MANRRMISLKVADTDAFLEMPQSSQMLYFHLAIRGDDDGFISNPKKIMKMLGNNEDDMRILVGKKFIIAFDSGVIVIKHWRIHNLIRADRYTPTQYIKELEMLKIDEKTKKYSLNSGQKPLDIPNGNQRVSQVRLGKDRVGKDSKEKKEKIDVDKLWIKMLKPYTGKYSPLMIQDFEDHWRAKNEGGKKEHWQKQNTFDIKRRLATWKRRGEGYQHQNEARQKLKFVNEKPTHRNDGGTRKQNGYFNSIEDIIKK